MTASVSPTNSHCPKLNTSKARPLAERDRVQFVFVVLRVLVCRHHACVGRSGETDRGAHHAASHGAP
jgi:hypothetical protein